MPSVLINSANSFIVLVFYFCIYSNKLGLFDTIHFLYLVWFFPLSIIQSNPETIKINKAWKNLFLWLKNSILTLFETNKLLI